MRDFTRRIAIISALVVATVVVIAFIEPIPSHASGNPGFFTDTPWSDRGGSGQNVLYDGAIRRVALEAHRMPSNTPEERRAAAHVFVNAIHWWLRDDGSGDIDDLRTRLAAAYIVCTMTPEPLREGDDCPGAIFNNSGRIIGVRMTYRGSGNMSPTLRNWTELIYRYAELGLISWNEEHSDRLNTLTDSTPNGGLDIFQYTKANPGSYASIVFRHPVTSAPIYAIKHICANPVGHYSGLVPIGDSWLFAPTARVSVDGRYVEATAGQTRILEVSVAPGVDIPAASWDHRISRLDHGGAPRITQREIRNVAGSFSSAPAPLVQNLTLPSYNGDRHQYILGTQNFIPPSSSGLFCQSIIVRPSSGTAATSTTPGEGPELTATVCVRYVSRTVSDLEHACDIPISIVSTPDGGRIVTSEIGSFTSTPSSVDIRSINNSVTQFHYLRQVGTTGGASRARNTSLYGGAWRNTTALPGGALYARPGDSIQFCHGSYRGAQEVTATRGTPPRDFCSIFSTPQPKSEWGISFDPNPFTNCTDSGVMEQLSDTQIVRGDIHSSDVGQTFRQNMTYSSIRAENRHFREAHTTWPGCPYSCGEYGDSTCHACTNWEYTSRGTEFININDDTAETTEQVIRVPYNYNIQTNISVGGGFRVTNNGTRIAAPGTNISIAASFDVQRRTNPQLAAQGFPGQYATITKETEWRLSKFILDPGTPVPVTTSGTSTGRDNGPCEHLGLGTGNRCGVATHDQGVNNQRYALSNFTSRSLDNHLYSPRDTQRVFNTEGNPVGVNGSSEQVFGDPSVGFYVDDLVPGSQICYMLSVFPASSDDRRTTTSHLDDTHDGDSWAHSQPVCITVAKRPLVSIIGGGLFVAGDIITNQTTKTACGSRGLVDQTVNFDGYFDCDVHPGTRNLFGSWVEYEVIARGQIHSGGRTIASGAAFSLTPLLPSSLFPTTIGHLFPVEPNPPTRGEADFPKNPMTPNTLSYSPLTFSNTNTSSLGNFELDRHFRTSSLVRRLQDRADGICDPIIDTSEGASTTCNTSSLTIDGFIAEPRSLVIINATGTVTINGDIIYSDTSHTNISDIPQVIIIAPTIEIAPHVRRIDAWLIAGTTSDGRFIPGTLSTCHSFAWPLDIHTCNTQLQINGPVITGGLSMNRTYGAGNRERSAEPSEIFNLRADTHLWAFYQTQQNRAAQTTFSQELPPRL